MEQQNQLIYGGLQPKEDPNLNPRLQANTFMRFCKDCGTVLNLFSDQEIEYCSACIQHKKKAEIIHVPIPGDPDADHSILDTATLSLENGKIILRSQEGWELWSCNQGSSTELKTVLSRAKRIYEIRLRRQKN